MQHVIMAIHLMTVVALVTLILYQKSEGGALGLGQSGFFSGRGQANALTRATSILATVFFVTSVLLTVIPSWERRSLGGEDWTKAVEPEKMQLKEIKPEAAPQAQKEIQIPKEKESVFEQLKRAQEQRQQGAGAPALRSAPEVPAAPAPQSEPPAAPAPKAAAPETSAPKSEAPAAPAPKIESAPAAPEPAAPKAEAKPEAVKPAPETAPPPPVQWKSPAGEPAASKPEALKPASEAAPAPSAPPAVQWKSPGAEPTAPKSEAPAAAAPKVESAPAAPEPAAPKVESAPKAEAKPEEAKPAPEAAPAPSAPPAAQWKSPTK